MGLRPTVAFGMELQNVQMLGTEGQKQRGMTYEQKTVY